MLSVRQTASRFVSDLSGIWDFKLDDGTIYAGDQMPGILKGADPIAVPASFNDQKDVMEYRDHYGWVFYQRKLQLPTILNGQRIWLRFEAVAHEAKVFN